MVPMLNYFLAEENTYLQMYYSYQGLVVVGKFLIWKTNSYSFNSFNGYTVLCACYVNLLFIVGHVVFTIMLGYIIAGLLMFSFAKHMGLHTSVMHNTRNATLRSMLFSHKTVSYQAIKYRFFIRLTEFYQDSKKGFVLYFSFLESYLKLETSLDFGILFRKF